MQSKHKLGLFDLTMIVVSLVIGMGIFRTPVNVAAKALSPAIFFGAWLAGGLVALCGALTYAEIGSRYPVTGGYFKIFSYCYHPALGFMINCIILFSNAASMSAVALIGAEYIALVLFPQARDVTTVKQIIAIVAILVFYGLNLLGLKMSARTQNLLTLVKISMILILILAVFVPGTAGASSAAAPLIATNWINAVKAFGICLIAVSFTYGGYQQTINFGGVVKNPARLIPRAIFLGIAIIILLYLSINYAYVKVIGFDALKQADSIAAKLAESLFGPLGDFLFRLLLFFSVLAYVNVLLMSNPQVIYAMSEEGLLPAVFRRRNSRTQVLTAALTAFAAVSILTLFFTATFDRLLNYTIFLDSIGMATSAATIFILRKKTAYLHRSHIYSMKLYPLLPLVFIAAYAFVAVSIVLDDPRSALYGFLLLVAFFPVYLVMRVIQRKQIV